MIKRKPIENMLDLGLYYKFQQWSYDYKEVVPLPDTYGDYCLGLWGMGEYRLGWQNENMYR